MANMIIFLLPLSLLLIVSLSAAAPTTAHARRDMAQTSVMLDYGSFVGKFAAPAASDSETLVRYHLGIPFAQPPVGGLRFKSPQAITANYGVYLATQFASNCMQMIDQNDSNVAGDAVSEDCLYLNVWTPPDVKPYENLPVAVWVYGGSFIAGATQNKIYDGANLVYQALKQGRRIIVVAPNYRVNAFGFLASPQMAQEGGLNLGLQDQLAAFKWVRKYIQNFGGNPNKVTAWGQSAGAISLGFHLTSSNAAPLFDQAILQSGGAYSGPALNWTANYGTLFKSVATQAGCTFGDVASELTCLRNVPAPQLLQYGLIAAQSSQVRYAPYIDFTYVATNPEKKLAAGQIQSMPLLIGDVADEGTMFTNVNTVAGYNSYMTDNFGSALPASVIQQTYALYPLSKYDPANAPFLATADIFGDFVFQCPVLNLASTFAQFSTAIDPVDCKPKVYKYKYAYPPLAQDYYLGQAKYGVYHGSELKYVHADQSMMSTQDQLGMMSVVSSLWISFIGTGNPNTLSISGLGKVIWPKYTSPVAPASAATCKPVMTSQVAAQQRLLIKSLASFAAEADTDRAKKCAFWNQFELGVSN